MKLLKDQEVAKVLGITVSQLRSDRILGRGLPFVREPGKMVRYHSDVVAAELDRERNLAGNCKPKNHETMTIKTAAPIYDVTPQHLQTLCTRGTVKGVLVGGVWFVTPAEMDRVFKGIEPPKVKGKVAPK